MKQETLQALKDSIAHWKKMRDDRNCGERPGSPDCALCRRFLRETRACVCHGERCPVYEATGKIGCQLTPFPVASNVFGYADEESWRIAAQQEIDFLESLLPTDNK